MADEKIDATDEQTEDYDSLVINYEDGTTENCEVLGLFDCEDNTYIALLPESDEDSVYLYGYVEHEDDTFSLVDIEDDELFARVAAAYEELLEGDDEDEDAE